MLYRCGGPEQHVRYAPISRSAAQRLSGCGRAIRGRNVRPTFPADWWLPPVVAIDHVLARGCTATSLRTIKIPWFGSSGPRRDGNGSAVVGDGMNPALAVT